MLDGKAGQQTRHIANILAEAVEYMQKRLEIKKTIFMGTSMGGYGALSASMLNQCNEVYITSPITSLKQNLKSLEKSRTIKTAVSTFTESIKDNIFSYELLDIPKMIENQSSHINVLGRRKKYIADYYHILACRQEDLEDRHGLYLEEYILPLTQSLNAAGVKYSLQILPLSAHDALFYPAHVDSYSNNYNNILKGKLIEQHHNRKSLIEQGAFVNSIRLAL